MALAASSFTLSWTHSVERVLWVEYWTLDAQGLRPIEAEVQGSGAGMELPEGAWPTPSGWRYAVTVPPQKTVHLAASGETPDPWTLCTDKGCHKLGAEAQAPIRLWTGDCGIAVE